MRYQAASTLGLLIACGGALAQSNVTIYGILDTGVEYYDNANAAGDTVIRQPSLTASIPSRIGFRGTEDLGNQLRANFVLENGVLMDSGGIGQGNRLFGRQAWVGLSGPFGAVMVGRQNTMTMYALTGDLLGPHIHGLSAFDSYFPNARSDNTLGYMGTFSGVTIGATYSLGRDTSAAGGPAATNCPGEVPGNSQACRQWTALLKYDQRTFGVAASYDIMNGNTAAGGGLTRSGYTDERISLSGYKLFGPTKLGGGIVRRTTSTATERETDLIYFGVSQKLTPVFVLDARVAHQDVKDSGNDSTAYVLRGTYSLSKRTSLYTSLGYMKNRRTAAVAVSSGGSVGAGLNQKGVMVGMRHTF
jgi:predicted porin